MERAARHLAVQYAVADTLAASTTLAEAASRILPAVCGILGWTVGALWTVDERAGALRCAATWSAPSSTARGFAAASEAAQFPPGIGLPGRVWSRAESQWIPDVMADTNFPRAAAAGAAGLHGAFAVPVHVEGRVIGVLELLDDERQEPDAELLQVFASVGGQLGQAIERIRAREALRETAARLSGIVHAAADAVIGMDADGRVLDWNPAAETLFGWSREEVLGRALVTTIVPERYRDRHRAGLARFLATGEGAFLDRHVEIEAVRRDGREVPIDLSIVPVRLGRAHVFAAFLRDISERKRDEERLRFLAEVGAVLAGSLDLETTLTRVAHVALAALADYCLVHLLEDGGRLRRVAAVCRDPEIERRWAIAQFPELLAGAADHPAVVALRERRTVRLDRIGDAERRRLATSDAHLAFLRSIPLEEWLAVPLVARGELVGVMGFGAARPERRWDERDLGLAEELARRAALAVENARLYRQARDAVRTRDEFLATVSHDLRNPLASVKGLAQLLRRRAERIGTPETLGFVESLGRIDAAASRMAALLDELIEVSGLRIGQPIELARAPVDLVALARDVARTTPGSDGRRIEVEAAEPSVVAAVDAPRIQRVLANLVGNAVKFSPPGSAIAVRVEREDGAALIAVRDEGFGIPPADLPHVFERFRRGSNVADRVPGTGIGLTSAKQIVELHGGSIEVQSAEGKGSTFTVRLPLAGEASGHAPAPGEGRS